MSEEIEPSYEERSRLSMKASELSIIEAANADFAEFQRLGAEMGAKIIEGVNKGRDIGIRLQSLRAQNKHWEQLTLGMGEPTGPTLSFSEQYGKGFLRLAERHAEPVTTVVEAMGALKDIAMLQGVLPFPQPHGEQQLQSRDPFSDIVKHVMEIQQAWNKNMREEILSLPPEKKRFCRAQLEPIVRIYELLAA